ncbi:hypothetical protein TSMEX_011276 [Taenia solium]|eukprot:TsM_001060100 transcript=TsM_001060100 gene=TsM_001060100
MADALRAFLTSVRAELDFCCCPARQYQHPFVVDVTGDRNACAAVDELSKLTGQNLKNLEDLCETLEKDNRKDELTFKEFVEALDKLKNSQGGIKKLQEDYKEFPSQSALPSEFEAYISTTEGALKVQYFLFSPSNGINMADL